MRCPACQALTGQPVATPPHAALVEIGRRPYATAGWIGGEEAIFRCGVCGGEMGRDTDAFDPFSVWVNR